MKEKEGESPGNYLEQLRGGDRRKGRGRGERNEREGEEDS